MTAIIHDLKLVYLFEPHTASRATLEAIVEAFPDCETTKGHHTYADEHPEYKNYNYAVTIRNPFDVMVTKYYHFGFYKHVTFPIFVRRALGNRHGAAAVGYYKDANIFCRYENLLKDLEALFKRTIPLKHLNKHKTKGKNPWPSYYTPDLVEKLQNLPSWKEYLERFNYGFHQN